MDLLRGCATALLREQRLQVRVHAAGVRFHAGEDAKRVHRLVDRHPAAAQRAADQLVAAGVEGILNFAPVTLSLPENVSLVGVDLATELEQLCFSVANRQRNR